MGITEITYYGHSCFGITLGNTRVLIDPFISGNPLASTIDVSGIQADYIFVTHAHGDHIGDLESIAKNGGEVISTYEIANWAAEKGIKGTGLNIGGVWSGPFGQVRLVNAIHSSEFPDGRYGGQPCGFVFMTTESTFYVSGDTALTLDMKLIPELCNDIDFCILCLGGHFTMDPSDALKAAEMIHCSTVVGCHFDSFPPIEIDHQEALDLFADKGMTLKLPAVGEHFTI